MQSLSEALTTEAGEVDLAFPGSRRGSGDGASLLESVHSNNSSGKRSWADDAQTVPWGAASASRRPSMESLRQRAISPFPARASPLPTIESPLLPQSDTATPPLPVDTTGTLFISNPDLSPKSSSTSTFSDNHKPVPSPTSASNLEIPSLQSTTAVSEGDAPTTESKSKTLLTTADVINSHSRLGSVTFESPITAPTPTMPDADEVLRLSPGIIGLGEGWANVKPPRRRSWFVKSKPVELDPLALWETTAQTSGPSKISPLAGMKESFSRSRLALFKPSEQESSLSTISKAKGMFSRSRLNLSTSENEDQVIQPPQRRSIAVDSLGRKRSIMSTAIPTSPSPSRLTRTLPRKSSITSFRSEVVPPSPVPTRSTSLGGLPGPPPPWRPMGGPATKSIHVAPLITKIDSATSLDTLYQHYSPDRQLRRTSTFGQSVSPASVRRSLSISSSVTRRSSIRTIASRSTSLSSSVVTPPEPVGLVGMLPLNDIDPFAKSPYPYRSQSASAYSSHVDISESSYRVSEIVAEELIKLSPRQTPRTERRKSWLPQTFSTDNLSKFFERDEVEKAKKPSFVKRLISRKSGGKSRSASVSEGLEIPKASLPISGSMPYMSNFNDSTMTLDLDFDDDGDLGLDDILDSRRRARIVRSIKVDRAAAQTPWSAAHKRGFSFDGAIPEVEEDEEDDEEEDDEFDFYSAKGPSTDSLGNALKNMSSFPLPPSSSKGSASSPDTDYTGQLETPRQSGDGFSTPRASQVASPAPTASTLVSGQHLSPKASWDMYPSPLLEAVIDTEDLPALAALSVGSETGESDSDSNGEESAVHGQAVHVQSMHNLARATYLSVN